jgi:hypothetical protein
MGVLATIREFLAPLSHSAREIRQENLTVADANRLAAAALLREERNYWVARMRRQLTAAEVKEAREHLDMLDEMEARSHG